MAPSRFSWSGLLGLSSHPSHDHHQSHHRLLPSYRDDSIVSAIPAEDVTKIAIRIRYLVEECVPCELAEELITQPHSRIITRKVVLAAKEAGGAEHRACVVFCLLTSKRWFKHQALVELWDADLHKLRAKACEMIAKYIIEDEDNMDYLLQQVLLKRYSIISDGAPTRPVNVIEQAVDLHALPVIASSGYQKCISYLWRGWLVQDENDPSSFVDYKNRDNTSFWPHLDPDRMRAPVYQNAFQLLVSILYLVLYTIVINTINAKGGLDIVEIILYIFTAGFIFDELTKFYKAGYHILGFWNAFNNTLYSLLVVSLAFRIVALGYPVDHDTEGGGDREKYNSLSYNLLALTAPMFYGRLLLYLDTVRFFGAMLVVLKVMMKESLIFFALLVVVIIGFLQAFIGMDVADDGVGDATLFILQAMVNAIMQSPDFSGFERFAHPFGIILYYIFTFVIMVILLNILIALYNSSYEDIYQNADDEYLALFSHKTMQFVRAPDENVFIAPFNLIEIFVLVIPFEWWLPKEQYEYLNDAIMGIIYSPLLFGAAIFETRTANEIRFNRQRGEADDDSIEEWEELQDQVDFEGDGWAKKVCDSKSNVEEEPAVVEVKKLRQEIDELKDMLKSLTKSLEAKKEDSSLI
ncbi:uncharacterized protein B0I36DRAFT_239642 [Microdochium trichocladiopsis]|uniref:Ion transport domain-containing protein n=1 Tax=Microdochium trichocladiopsis TaxID=1682393 RepID=A0A9P8YCI8_9PEZI|nr:uncharacterized protein B0I36DRAFT_239642 [Microdochium trichocladiopsis]KAH7035767.1 hypothetical protein B0I36DRAFT_239642 [Microdochium trichocladiopsis]